MDEKRRCRWCNTSNARYVAYHDTEWGVGRFDDAYLYEMLLLESFQAGLSWECVLNKRDSLREAFDGFDVRAVAAYDERKVNELLSNAALIRNRRKILAVIQNSRIFLQIVAQFGSFQSYLLRFTHGMFVQETDRTTSALSDAISADLKARGMTFVGSVIIYSYLQAIGVIRSHEPSCYLYATEGDRSNKQTNEQNEPSTPYAAKGNQRPVCR